MNITIFALGSRGDIQPALALAVGLNRGGHRVTLVAPHTFADWIRSYGVLAHPVAFDFHDLRHKPEIQAAVTTRNPLRQIRVVRSQLSGHFRQALDGLWEATQDADFVLQTGGAYGAVDIAERRHIPMAFVWWQPIVTPTRAFPSFALPVRASLGGRYNYLTYILMVRASWYAFGGALNQWRTTQLDLPPWSSAQAMFNARRRFGTPWLHAWSPRVLPKPPEWDTDHHVTGYWFLDTPPNWQPTPALARFLERGSPPVYIGFGSMTNDDPERVTRVALRALELSGQRAVFGTGWGAMTRLDAPSHVCYVDDVPHSWLFPRMAAVVHHGGAGTTAAGLRAGVPGIIAPFGVDQYAWADRVAHLGVGPRAAPIKQLTAEQLAAAIHRAVHDPTLRARATALGTQIRAEDGLASAAELIERHAAAFNRRREAMR